MPAAPAATDAKPATIDFFGYGLAVVGAVLFSSKAIFVKLAYQYGVASETILAIRMLVAVPVYLVILVGLVRRQPGLIGKLRPRPVLGAAAVGLLGYYFSSFLDFEGLNYLSAQIERLVLFTYPFFVLLFGVWFFGDRMSWSVLPGMLLSYLGLMVIFSWNLSDNPEGAWLGAGLILTSALTFALYQHLARRQMRTIGSGLFTCIGMSAAGIGALVQNTLWHGVGSYGAIRPEVWGLGLALGIFGTVIPSFFLNAAIHRIGPRGTASTGNLGPLFTIAMAVVILGEPFTIFHAIGTGLVMAGFLWFGRAEARAKAAQVP